MEKVPKRNSRSGHFVVGRYSTEKISAVEGLRRGDRTGRLIELSDRLGETPAQLRDRIRTEFRSKK